MPHSLFLPPPPSPMALPPPFLPSANLVKLSPHFCPPKCISLPVCPTVSISVFACLRLDLTFQPETIVLSLSCVHVVFVSVLCKRHHCDGNPFKTIKYTVSVSPALLCVQLKSAQFPGLIISGTGTWKRWMGLLEILNVPSHTAPFSRFEYGLVCSGLKLG